jgi:hypothetical protein
MNFPFVIISMKTYGIEIERDKKRNDEEKQGTMSRG